MKCDKIKKQLVFYDEALLSEKERLSVEAHLKECSACAQELKELRDSLKVYVEHEETELAPEPSPFLFAKISSEVKRSGRRKGAFVLRFAFGMAFAFLFAAIASRFMTPEREVMESQRPERALHQAHKIERIKNKLATQGKEQIKAAKIQTATPVRHPVIAKASKKTYKTARLEKKHRFPARVHKKQGENAPSAEHEEITDKYPFDKTAEEDVVAFMRGQSELKSPEVFGKNSPNFFENLLKIAEVKKKQAETLEEEKGTILARNTLLVMMSSSGAEMQANIMP